MQPDPKFYYDPKADAIYFFIRQGDEEECLEIAPHVYYEVDAKGEILGIEILKASQFLEQIVHQRKVSSAAQAIS